MTDDSKVNVVSVEKNKKHNKYSWIAVGVCISMVVAIIFSSFYGIFENAAREKLNNPLESEEQLSYLYENSYVLYRNLYNRQNQTKLGYVDLYLDVAEGYEWLLYDETFDMDSYEFMNKMVENPDSEEDTADFTLYDDYVKVYNYINNRFKELENSFSQINSTYDYLIQDVDTGEYVTNLTTTDINYAEQFLYVSFIFDENGNATLSNDIKGNDVTKLRKNASEAIRSKSLYDYTQNMELVFVAGFFWPAFKTTKPWNQMKICRRMPVEGLCVLAYLTIGMLVLTVYLIMWVNGGSGVDSLAGFLPRTMAWCIVYGINILVLTAFLFVAWYIGICLRALREKGVKEYFRERSFLYKIFPATKIKFMEFYDEVSHFDVTKNARKLIVKMVVVNGIILFVIGCFPLGGLAVAVVYSVILYFILKKYISDLQKKYSILLKATNEVAEGNLNGSIIEDLGVFEPFKPQVIRIRDGFKKAVEDEVKSQRLKSVRRIPRT